LRTQLEVNSADICLPNQDKIFNSKNSGTAATLDVCHFCSRKINGTDRVCRGRVRRLSDLGHKKTATVGGVKLLILNYCPR
jgi:hypothetical protein